MWFLIKVYTVCHSSCSLKTHQQVVKWTCSKLRLVDLEFNEPVNTIMIILPNHTFPGQAWSAKWLNSTCTHFFARKWHVPFLNHRKRENECRKYFMINLQEKNVARPVVVNPQPSDRQSDTYPTKPPRPGSHCLPLIQQFFRHMVKVPKILYTNLSDKKWHMQTVLVRS